MLKSKSSRYVAEGAVIASLYAVLTLVLAPVSFGPVQIRVAEALAVMPLFTPAAVPGLFVGCIFGNLLSGAIVWDVIFGSLATLAGAIGGYLLRSNRWLVPLPTVVSNTLVVPFVLKYGYGITDTALHIMAFFILAGEIAGCYVLGELLASALINKRINLFEKIG